MKKTAVSALVAGLVLALAPASQAATNQQNDPSDDMTASIDGWTEGVNVRDGDILFNKTTFTSDTIKLESRFVEFKVKREHFLFWDIQGGNGKYLYVEAHKKKGATKPWTWTLASNPILGWERDPGTTVHEVSCHGFGHTIDPGHWTAKISVPKSCLHDPGKVRSRLTSIVEITLHLDRDTPQDVWDGSGQDDATASNDTGEPVVPPWGYWTHHA